MYLSNNLHGLSDPAVWEKLYRKYNWQGNEPSLTGWSTVYGYEGRVIPDELLKKAEEATKHLWDIRRDWMMSDYDLAEQVLIMQTNIIRQEWGMGPISKKFNYVPIIIVIMLGVGGYLVYRKYRKSKEVGSVVKPSEKPLTIV